MYQNAICIYISWYSKSCWFPMKKCWCQQNSWSVSRDLYIFVIFFRSGKTVLSYHCWVCAAYFRTGWPFLASSICEPPLKRPSWGELKWPACLVQMNCNIFSCRKLINRWWRQFQTQMYLLAVLRTYLYWLNVCFWLFLLTLILFEQLLGHKFSMLLMKNPQCSSVHPQCPTKIFDNFVVMIMNLVDAHSAKLPPCFWKWKISFQRFSIIIRHSIILWSRSFRHCNEVAWKDRCMYIMKDFLQF